MATVTLEHRDQMVARSTVLEAVNIIAASHRLPVFV